MSASAGSPPGTQCGGKPPTSAPLQSSRSGVRRHAAAARAADPTTGRARPTRRQGGSPDYTLSQPYNMTQILPEAVPSVYGALGPEALAALEGAPPAGDVARVRRYAAEQFAGVADPAHALGGADGARFAWALSVRSARAHGSRTLARLTGCCMARAPVSVLL